MDKTETNNGARSSIGTDYLDALSKSQGSNRDTEGLGVMTNGRFMIGSVDEINGQGGEEVPGFAATRHELERLAAYWWTERINHDWDYFVYQSSGSSEWRRSVYTNRRLNRLYDILGEKAMDKVIDDETARWRKLYKISDEDWRVFTQGSDQEKDAWREAQWRKQEEAEALAAVRELAEDASKSEGK
jgi:hypothetical protein